MTEQEYMADSTLHALIAELALNHITLAEAHIYCLRFGWSVSGETKAEFIRDLARAVLSRIASGAC